MSGKRISRERIPEQIRMEEEMSSNLRLVAQINKRSPSLQILVYVERGLKSDLELISHSVSQPQSAEVKNGHRQSERRSA